MGRRAKSGIEDSEGLHALQQELPSLRCLRLNSASDNDGVIDATLLVDDEEDEEDDDQDEDMPPVQEGDEEQGNLEEDQMNWNLQRV